MSKLIDTNMLKVNNNKMLNNLKIFSNITNNTNTISASNKSDTLTIIGNVVDYDVNNKKISIDVTPNKIGAAAASHGNHVPTTQTANNAVFLRNDNTWATVTPANIGAATSGHTHTTSLATDTGTSAITLAHGSKYKLTAGGNSVIFTMPTDNNTDTKVTSVDNHYAPTENTSSQLSADASSTTAATWNSTSLVTGVDIKRDAKGHVTGIAVDSIKMPANPNTNTTYTLSSPANANTIVLTPSSGSANTVTLKAGSNVTLNGGTAGEITISSSYTNTDTMVTQNNSTSNASHRLLLEPNADNTNRTTTTIKSANFTANPSTGQLTVGSISSGNITSSGTITATTFSGKATSAGTADVANAVAWSNVSGKPSFLALGETSSTAYRGDRGVIAYNHSQAAHAPSNAQPNQNAFSVIGDTNGTAKISANAASTTLKIVGGGATTVSYDDTNKKLTISSTDNNTVYTHPTYSAKDSGLYKITVDGTGHVSAATAVTKADITGLGIPGSDTNNAVTQTATNTNANYEVLFSGTADNTTRTEGARKYSNLTFNPSTGNLNVTKINGVDVGSSPKFTDTNTWRGIQNNLTSDSTSDSLSAAQGKVLKALVDGKAAASHTHSYLPLSGGNLTGELSYNNKWETFVDNTDDCLVFEYVG